MILLFVDQVVFPSTTDRPGYLDVPEHTKTTKATKYNNPGPNL
jgi:hypothetical protein